MTKFADVTLNQLRILSKSTGSLLAFTTKKIVSLYWVNQGPVIFRSVMKLDSNAFLFLNGLPHRIELRSNLDQNSKPEEFDQTVRNRINQNPLLLIR